MRTLSSSTASVPWNEVFEGRGTLQASCAQKIMAVRSMCGGCIITPSVPPFYSQYLYFLQKREIHQWYCKWLTAQQNGAVKDKMVSL